MITIHSIPSTPQKEAVVSLPPETTLAEIERFSGLAKVFYGHYNPDGTWVFTEVRGEKCWLLYRHGFVGLGVPGKLDRRCITHPKDGKRYLISRAVACARLMEPAMMEVD